MRSQVMCKLAIIVPPPVQPQNIVIAEYLELPQSKTFRLPNFIMTSPHIITFVWINHHLCFIAKYNSCSVSTFVFKIHLSFCLHQCTQQCQFLVRMVRVLRIFILVNPWNRNCLRTVLEEIVFGKTLYTLFALFQSNFVVCSFSHSIKSSCHRSQQFSLVDHFVVHFHNFYADWNASSVTPLNIKVLY